MTLKEYYEKKELNLERVLGLMERGVEFIDIDSVYIGMNVRIGKGTVIGPCVQLQGNTVIGEDCLIDQNTRIKDSTIGDGAKIESSVILESEVGDKTLVGPFAYIRPGSVVGRECKVGDFVELKNTNFGNGSKSSHLSYIGDADVGENVNIGCGVVFVNYDGTSKHRSKVKDGAFIGCNANLVSPVTVEEGAYIAAGSTVTKNVPSDALCVARTKQRVIEGWAKDRGLYKVKK